MNRLICSRTGETYPLDDLRWCSQNGGLLDLEFAASFDPEQIKYRPKTMWRYREAIPIRSDTEVISFDEGFTPLQRVRLGKKSLLVKLDFLFPTGSFKDRGASVLITQVKSLGIKKVVQDSSGNAGCAVACYCARAGIECEIFVPDKTSPGKLAQIAMYGASLSKVRGSREDTAAAAFAAAKNHFYASHVWNPFFFQGTKTFAYEICEQLEWQAPDTVVLPAGNGTLLLGTYIGFKDLLLAGIIRQMPKLVVVQAAHCAPLHQAFTQGLSTLAEIKPQATLAEGIAIARPLRGEQMLATIAESGGQVITVEEEEIRKALTEVSRQGFYVEPTTGAVVAGARNYLEQEAQEDELVVSVFTGHGLKSSEKMTKLCSLKH